MCGLWESHGWHPTHGHAPALPLFGQTSLHSLAGEIGRFLCQSEGASVCQLGVCWEMQPDVARDGCSGLRFPASKTCRVPLRISCDDQWTNNDSLTVWNSGLSDQGMGHKEMSPNNWGWDLPRLGSSPSSEKKEKYPSFPSAHLPLPIWALSSLVWDPYKTELNSHGHDIDIWSFV